MKFMIMQGKNNSHLCQLMSSKLAERSTETQEELGPVQTGFILLEDNVCLAPLATKLMVQGQVFVIPIRIFISEDRNDPSKA